MAEKPASSRSDPSLDVGKPLVANAVPSWLSSGQASSCLELRSRILAHWKNHYGDSLKPMSWPEPLGAVPKLSERKVAGGPRVPMSEDTAKTVGKYLAYDHSALNRYLSEFAKNLGLPAPTRHVNPLRMERRPLVGVTYLGESNIQLRGILFSLSGICEVFVERLEKAAIGRSELPWGWDAKACAWPDAPVQNMAELADYFKQFVKRVRPDESARQDPARAWSLRKTIHAALDDFGVPCPLRRTSCPSDYESAYGEFVEILNWLRDRVAMDARRAKSSASGSNDWTDWVLTKNAKLWFADDITSRSGWTAFAKSHAANGLLEKRKIGREVRIHRSLFVKYGHKFPTE